MQASCTQCGQRISIDDAKVPDRPFVVKCPKCQSQVKLPGKAAAPAPPPPAEAPPPAEEETRAQMMAQVRRELSVTDGASLGRAMVVLPEQGLAGTMTLTLSRIGFQVETIDDLSEAFHLLEQGVFTLVATSRTPPTTGKAESFYQRLNRLSIEARRKVFVCLCGGELKTGDGMQAFSLLVDLVVNPKDAGTIDSLVRACLAERNRLYKGFLDVIQKRESSPA